MSAPEVLKALERAARPYFKSIVNWRGFDRSRHYAAADPMELVEAPEAPVYESSQLPSMPSRPDGVVRLLSRAPLEVFADERAARAAASALLAFSTLHRLPPDAIFQTKSDYDIFDKAVAAPGPALRECGPVLLDAWMPDTHSLRLRLEVEAQDSTTTGIRLYQISGANPATTEETSPLCCVASSGLRVGQTFVTAKLVSGLMPILIALVNSSGQCHATGVIAFPSLARSGLHMSELAALAPCAAPATAFLSYDRMLLERLLAGRGILRRLRVHNAEALQSEPTFSPEVAEWLSQIFDIEIEFVSQDDASGVDPGAPVLTLPADCLPTVTALTARRLCKTDSAGRPVGHLVCDRVDNQPCQAVHLPRQSDRLNDCQPRGRRNLPILQSVTTASETNSGSGFEHDPVKLYAIRFAARDRAHEAAILFPHSPDKLEPILPSLPTVNPETKILCRVVVSASQPPRRLLETLSRQRGAGRLHVMLVPASEEIPESILSEFNRSRLSWEAMPPDWDPYNGRRRADLERLDAYPDDTVLLQISGNMILHDPRTIETLVKLLDVSGVAMAGCVSLSEQPGRRGSVLTVESGGYFPTRLDLVGAPSLVFSEIDTLVALPDSTYPVIAPPQDVFAMRLNALHRAHRQAPWMSGSDQAALLSGLALTARGEICLCTSAVRALGIGAVRYREAMDCVSSAELPATCWQELCERITLVQEIR